MAPETRLILSSTWDFTPCITTTLCAQRSSCALRATALATVLEPLLIVAMGMVVMLIVLAVLLPIIEMNQLVR